MLNNNGYILVDHDGMEFPRPVNGNSIRPVALRSLIVNDMAPPPALAQREKRTTARVALKELLQKTRALVRVGKKVPSEAPTSLHPPARRLWLRLGPPPAGSGAAPV